MLYRTYMSFTLPELPYDPDALEPYIDKQTMEIHHGKHHATYVDKLNAAIEKYPDFGEFTLEELITHLEQVPEDIRTAVRNNGGGHYNHSLFWDWMSPTATITPNGELSIALNSTFGSFATFKEEFSKTAMDRFGSGWAWLVQEKEGKLSICSTANQDNPLTEGKKPILGLDVWEHAYYLRYQNRRAEYIQNWWNVVNWEKISLDFEK